MHIERVPLTNKWIQIYVRKENMDSITISNRGAVRVHFAPQEARQKEQYRVLDPGDWVQIDTDVKFLYAETETGDTTLELTTHFFSPEKLKEYEQETIAFWKKVMPGGILR